MDKDDRFTLKYAYEELWRCRDFELKHLWQRSVFLGTFLLAAFAGYGHFILQWCEHAHTFSLKDNLTGFAVAFVGLVLSLLWIMLAKGSKAWYERYESAIYHFSELADISVDMKQELYDTGVENVIGFAYGESFNKYSAPVSSWPWNTKGGAFSPSKINIAIGHLAACIWLVAIVFHVAVAKFGAKKIASMTLYNQDLGLTMVSLLAFGLLFFWLYSKVFLKSGVLEEKR